MTFPCGSTTVFIDALLASVRQRFPTKAIAFIMKRVKRKTSLWRRRMMRRKRRKKWRKERQKKDNKKKKEEEDEEEREKGKEKNFPGKANSSSEPV